MSGRSFVAAVLQARRHDWFQQFHNLVVREDCRVLYRYRRSLLAAKVEFKRPLLLDDPSIAVKANPAIAMQRILVSGFANLGYVLYV